MKTKGQFLALIVIMVCISACSNVVAWLLAERHTVTSGYFHGFEIGMNKKNALPRIKELGVTKIEDLKEGRFCTISNTNWKPPSPYDLVQFYDSSVHPNGATYCLYFKNDRLIRIDYLRERVQIE